MKAQNYCQSESLILDFSFNVVFSSCIQKSVLRAICLGALCFLKCLSGEVVLHFLHFVICAHTDIVKGNMVPVKAKIQSGGKMHK